MAELGQEYSYLISVGADEIATRGVGINVEVAQNVALGDEHSMIYLEKGVTIKKEKVSRMVSCMAFHPR